MKPGANFKQAGDAALDRDASLSRLGDARQDFQEGRFAGPVAADNAENLASPDLEADLSQCPELLDRVAGDHGTAAQHVGGPAQYPTSTARQHVAQGDIAFSVGRVAELVSLAEPLGPDHDIVGHVTPGS